jgi:hypothetical protein
MAAGLSAGAIGLIGAGASVLGGVMGASAAGDAADAQLAAAREASNTQRYMYDQTRMDQAPYRDVGYSALDALRARLGLQISNPSPMPYQIPYNGQGGPSSASNAPWTTNAQFNPQQLMQEDPSYQFRLAEGEKALNRSAAAGSGQLSGATLKALSKYNQNFASNEFTNSINRLSALAGVGQSATNQVGAAGNAMANNVSDLQTQMGNARAAGYVGQANAWNKGIGGAIGAIQDQSILNSLKQPTWANAFNAGYGDTSRYDAYAPPAIANGGWGIE